MGQGWKQACKFLSENLAESFMEYVIQRPQLRLLSCRWFKHIIYLASIADFTEIWLRAIAEPADLRLPLTRKL